MLGMTYSICTAMPSSSRPAPIAIACLGPSAQPLLAALNACTPPGVQLLAADALATQHQGQPAGLLILVAQQASDADNQAILTLAQQLQDGTLALPTLCVVVPPPQSAPEKQKTLAHYALQALQAQADATVLLPAEPDQDLPAWLAQVVGAMACSLGDGVGIGIDLQDLTRLLQGAGLALWVSVQASGPGKAAAATQQLLAHPWLVGLAPQSSHKAAVWVSAAPQTLKLSESRDILRSLQPRLHPDATLHYSVQYDTGLGEALRVSALFAGMAVRH